MADEVPSARRWAAILVVIGLLVGGVIVPVFGWFAAEYFFLQSDVWSNRQKLMGTFVLPGGWMLFAYVLFGGSGSTTCSGSHGDGARSALGACHQSGLALDPWLGALVVLLAFGLPLISAVVLLRPVAGIGKDQQALS